jgi:mannose-1-phosphate guanylyltransferase/mannose-1-phosphate guanylyltransferase/mannose-6-phosphate isomerase
MIPVILSGGSGTRIWPLSRSSHPKQFLPLVSEKSMFQETLVRLQGIEGMQAPLGICNESHRFMMAEQFREMGIQPSAIILEPVGKNTAPVGAMAALSAKSPDDVLLILAADHVIEDIPAFQKAVKQAEALAKKGAMVMFGIVPTKPETGYGYIKRGSVLGDAYTVEAFVEKPDLAKAQQYVDSGEYYWNSGMFAFTAGRYLEKLEKFSPEILSACRKAHEKAVVDMDFLRLDKEEFCRCPANSIDYAVMERTEKGVVIPLDAGWNDVGSWSSLWELANKDEAHNAVYGDVISQDTEDCFLYSDSRLVTTVGVKNLIIVETEDAVLVADKDKVQNVKEIVAKLKASQRKEANVHTKVYRPWGHYQSIDSGGRYQVKRLCVKPGAILSLQMHHHRAEHWVVVKGTALVTKDNEELLLSENESTYIPLGVKHRLKNPGVIPLEIIEVQSGSYLGEDDIMRFQDQYGRS